MTLTEIKRVIRETHHEAVTANGDTELTPVQKFQVYEQVLIGLQKEGHITEAQLIKWINVY